MDQKNSETGDLRCNQIQGMKVAGEFKKTFSSITPDDKKSI